MKQFYSFILCLFCFFQAQNGFSQNIDSPCGADYWRAKSLEDPAFYQKNEEYEQGILQVFEHQKNNPGLRGQVKVLPTVVHIIHNGGTENITDAQVQQAIAWLNQALANGGAFDQGSGANSGIELCLAQRTPDGQPTNGITRDQSPLTEMQMESNDLQIKNLNRWKTKDYVNIWLVRSICSTTYGCGVYGYSNYPFAHGSNIDGIVIEAAYVAQIEKITGLAHEMGHYLGLYHSFEGGCNNNNCMVDGDRICDTPPDKSTAGVPCTETVNTCSSDTQSGPFTTDQPDMSWNFMDYGIIACFHDYTADQATRMNATLDGVRHSLLDSKGCLPPCPANTIAAFTPSATAIGVGETVTFSNTSQNANTFTWTVNGTPFGNQPNANYTFNAPGTYTVLLTALPANATLCDISTASVVIQVVCEVTASFEVSNYSPDENQTVFLTNNSQNATQTEWFLDGISQGASLDSLNFSMAGTYEITLVTQNGPCQATSTLAVNVQGICDADHKLFHLKYQDPQSNWTPAGSVTVLADGNILVLFLGTGNNEDATYLVKMTPAGQQLWAKKVGDSMESFFAFKGLVATSDGGFAIAGNRGVATTKAVICKFSSNGDLLWLRESVENAKLVHVVATPDGKITACGYSNLPGDYYPIFVQYDASGALQWIKKYQIEGLLDVNTILAMPDSGFSVLGGDGLILRLSSSGNLVWHNWIQGASFLDAVVLPGGEIVACGSNTDNDKKGVWIKISPNGFPISIKNYLGNIGGSFFSRIISDGESGFVLITEDLQDKLGSIVDLDSTGNVSWTRKHLNAPISFFYGLTKFKDIGYLLVGNEFPFPNGSVLKTDRRGRIGNCPSETFPVTVTEVTSFVATQALSQEITPTQMKTGSVSVVDWLVIPDTVCTIACASPTEICNNNLDDDADGLFDCLDPDCNCTENRCDPKEANIWYFGNKAGLNFSTDPPTVLGDGQAVCAGMSATMCDVKGSLLFYTDGEKVYNRFHQPMPNGFLQPSNLVYQCIIVPNPDNASQYYVFVNYAGGMTYYSLVDMTLDDGRGDIVDTLGNKFLAFSSGLAAVKACGFQGYWLLTRTLETNSQFLAYRIDLNGLNVIPFSSISGQGVGAVRQLKISPDGKTVACDYFSFSNFDSTFVSTYRFDPYSIGTVSDPKVIAEYKTPYNPVGVEFSPNGRYLYVSGYLPG